MIGTESRIICLHLKYGMSRGWEDLFILQLNIASPSPYSLPCPFTSSKATGAILPCQSHFTILGTDKSSVKLLCVFIGIIFQHSPSRGEALFYPIDFLRTPITCVNHDKTLIYFIGSFSGIPRDSSSTRSLSNGT